MQRKLSISTLCLILLAAVFLSSCSYKKYRLSIYSISTTDGRMTEDKSSFEAKDSIQAYKMAIDEFMVLKMSALKTNRELNIDTPVPDRFVLRNAAGDSISIPRDEAERMHAQMMRSFQRFLDGDDHGIPIIKPR